MCSRRCAKLKILNISDNNIGPDKEQALDYILESCNELKVLDISGNNIGSDCAKAVARRLSCWNHLEELNISRNKIGPAGELAIKDELKFCDKLKVNLLDNDIDADDAQAVAGELKFGNPLEELHLSKNSPLSAGSNPHQILQGQSTSYPYDMHMFGSKS